MTNRTTDQPEPEEGRQKLRAYLHNYWVIDLNAAIEHGAQPIDAAIAMLDAAVNALVDIVPRDALLGYLAEVAAKVEAMPSERGTRN